MLMCDISQKRETVQPTNMATVKTVQLFGTLQKCSKFNFASVITRNIQDTTTESAKKITHTGQIYDDNDYRNVRFVDREKEVNDKWAIQLIADVPPTAAKDKIVACNGGGGPLGHPKVYINLDKPGNHTCGYCGLRFYKEDH